MRWSFSATKLLIIALIERFDGTTQHSPNIITTFFVDTAALFMYNYVRAAKNDKKRKECPMNCEYCGTEISKNAAFCPACGAKTGNPESPVQPEADPVRQAPDPAPYRSTEPSKPEKQKKPKKKKAWLVAVICVLAIAAAAFVAVNILNGTLKNLAVKLTKDDAGYMAYLNKRDVGALLDALDSALNTEDSSKSIEESATLSLEDSGKSFITKLTEGTFSLDWFGSMSLDYKSVIDGKKNGLSTSVSLNGKTIAEGQISIDNENEKLYVSAKDLIDGWLMLTAEQVNLTFGDLDSTEWRDIYVGGFLSYAFSALRSTTAGGVPNSVMNAIMSLGKDPDLTALLREYADLALDNIKNVEKDDKEISVGDVSVDCTEYTAEIDGKTIYNIAKALVKKAQKDEKLKDIISNFCTAYVEEFKRYGIGSSDADEMLDEFYDMLDDLEEDIADFKEDIDDFDDENKITYSVCVTNSGEIASRSLKITEKFRAKYYDNGNWGYEDDYSTKGTIVSLKTPRDGSTFALDFEVTDTYNGEKYEVVRLKGNGEASGTKLGGKFTLSIDDEKIADIAVEDVSIEKLSEKELSGKVTLTPGQEVMADLFDELFEIDYYEQYIKNPKIVIDLAFGKESSTVNAAICDGKDSLVSLELKAVKSDEGTVTFPTGESHLVRPENIRFNFRQIVANLRAAGLPERLADELANELESLFR